MKYFSKSYKSKGFTLVELLIATVVFAVVLVVVLSAFVQISRLFYKGVNMSRTQEDTRNIVQSISDDIKFSQIPPNFTHVNSPGSGYFCIGLHRYNYRLGYQLGSSTLNDYGIVRETVSFSSGCNPGAAAVNGSAEELLDSGMQLNNIDINCSGGRCIVEAHVVFYGGGDTTLFQSPSSYSPAYQAPDALCTGSLTDSQYCATADSSRTVLQRT